MAECHGCGSVLAPRQRKWCSEGCRKREARRQHLMKTYGITLEEYELIFDFQGGRCAICKRPPKAGKSLAVDHAHVDGRAGPIRGLLCFYDNRRVVGARSDQALIAAAEYVKEPPAQRALGKVVIAPGREPKKRRRKKK